METFLGDPLLHFKYLKWSDGKIMKNYGTKEIRLGKAGYHWLFFLSYLSRSAQKNE